MALSRPMCRPVIRTYLDILENPQIQNKIRLQVLRKNACFVFSEFCPCQLCKVYNKDEMQKNIPNVFQPPNIWCKNLQHWKKMYFPCCCVNFCDSKTDWSKRDECFCARCCECQRTTGPPCDRCKQKNVVYMECEHLKYEHSPCLFYDAVFDELRNDTYLRLETESEEEMDWEYTDPSLNPPPRKMKKRL